MRIALKALSVALMAGAVACSDTGEESFNPLAPDPTKAHIRLFNGTNTAVNMAGNGAAATTLDSNLGYGLSRCYSVDPANPGISVVTTAAGTAIPLPTFTFEAGKRYTAVLYNPTTPTATVTNYAYTIFDNATTFVPKADSAGLRILNIAPTAGAGIDFYANNPAVAPAVEPPLATNAQLRKVTNLPVGSMSDFFNNQANSSYQYRVTRTGVTTTTLLNTTGTLVEGENVTLIIGPPASGTTTVRGNHTQGC